MLRIGYPVRPWLHDHHFAGRTIFPAVEAMRVLAAAHARTMADRGVAPSAAAPLRLANARFLHLITVADDAQTLEFQIEAQPGPAGTGLALFWRKKLPGGMSRLIRALELELNPESVGPGRQPGEPMPERPSGGNVRRIAAERIYAELVPFGPAFRSLQGELELEGDAGFGHVLALPAPDIPELAGAECLGAPLPLDGAMHAACVHGLQFADFVPFPASFALRRIRRPIRTGECCEARLRLVRREADFLCYDLWLLRDGTVCEEVRSLMMRDVSGGKIGPPAWWRLW